MKRFYLIEIFKSDYCKLVFLISFFGSYFLIPKNVFYGEVKFVAILYMFIFSLTITCIVRNIKERVMLARTYKTSILGIIASAIGLSALQVCGTSGICVAASTGGLASILLPEIFKHFIEEYGVELLYFSIIIQMFAIFIMKCFSVNNYKDKSHDFKAKTIIDKKFVYAVIGVSQNKEKYGNKVYKELNDNNFKVFGVNPKAYEVYGRKTFKNLSDINTKIDVVVFVVPPAVTLKVLSEVKKLKIMKVWMQPGSENEEAVRFCEKNDIYCVKNACIITQQKVIMS